MLQRVLVKEHMQILNAEVFSQQCSELELGCADGTSVRALLSTRGASASWCLVTERADLGTVAVA